MKNAAELAAEELAIAYLPVAYRKMRDECIEPGISGEVIRAFLDRLIEISEKRLRSHQKA